MLIDVEKNLVRSYALMMYDNNYKELGMMNKGELLNEEGHLDKDKYIDAIPDKFYIHQDMDRLLGRESLACIDSDE